MRWARLTAALLCLATAATAAARDAEVAMSVALVDTLLVAAAPAYGPSVPATAGLVTRVEIDTASGFRDLSDLLGSVAGLQMARLGGWGTSAVPSLRGSAPAQIRFFLDGMPLPDAQTGQAGFGRLPLDRLAAVEVHRGTVPIGLGGVGGAGAVNFISRDRDEGWDAAVQGGSFGELGGRLGWGAVSADDRVAGLLMAHGHRTDNDFTYLDHNQTFHRGDDDTVRVRENAGLEEWGAWGSGRWRGDALTVRLAAGYTRRDGGRPGPLGYLSPQATVRYDRLDGQAHLDWREGLLRLDGSAGRGNEYLFDPAREVGLTPAGTTHARNEDLTGRVAWAPPLVPGRLDLTLGADWSEQRQTETVAGRGEPERNRRATGAFAAVTLSAIGGRLTLAPAWRWQRTRDRFPPAAPLPWLQGVDSERDDVSPSAGVVWEARPDRLFVEAHAARTVRVPTWVELFGHRGGVDGNSALRPERLGSADLAVSLRAGRRFTGRVAAFYAETDDKIAFVQNSPRSTKATNLDRTRARGLETELAVALPADLDLAGNLTVQRVTEEGDNPVYAGKAVPFLPEVEAHVRLSGECGPWRPWVAIAHLGANYRDRANTELGKAPARTLLNLGAGRDWRPDWLGAAGVLAVQAEVINLTDNAVYDVEGYPLPGRTWRLAASVRY